MGKDSNIAWTHHTFNPWWGCEKVSPACDHCYAESWAKRTGFTDLWSGARRFFTPKHWQEPLKWNRDAESAQIRFRVFCASMADVFDNHPDVVEARTRLWTLIAMTPSLDWLLLTKRIGNVKRMLPEAWVNNLPPNVWLGISVVNQTEFDRDVPKLIDINARIRFLSVEPMLAPIDPREAFMHERDRLHWIICGGESGSRARNLDPQWARELMTRCRAYDVPFFMKQGSTHWGPEFDMLTGFPFDLRVREYPR